MAQILCLSIKLAKTFSPTTAGEHDLFSPNIKSGTDGQQIHAWEVHDGSSDLVMYWYVTFRLSRKPIPQNCNVKGRNR